VNLAHKLGVGPLYEEWLAQGLNTTKGSSVKVGVALKQCYSPQGRQVVSMWESNLGQATATPSTMILALQKLPLTNDVIERIKIECII
jgi:hypothetical protein